MRKEYFKLLYKLMRDNNDIYALTADLGYGGFDSIKRDYKDRFFNCGASEQAMMDIAVGLVLAGKLPFTYTITPFYLRAYETIRTYINHEKYPIIMAGSGRDKDYEHDGVSHWADDIDKLFAPFNNIVKFYPDNIEGMKTAVESAVYMKQPIFISLKR